MDALVVYESMFGNTKAVAEAVSEGIRAHLDVELVEVGSAPSALPADLRLLVVGGPTHAFGMSRVTTRVDAAEEAPDGIVSTGSGLREWLEALEDGTSSTAAATFDTRVNHPRLPGSAAAAMHKRLKRLGLRPIARPMSFYVEGKTGPIVEGELARAGQWGDEIGSEFTDDVRASSI